MSNNRFTDNPFTVVTDPVSIANAYARARQLGFILPNDNKSVAPDRVKGVPGPLEVARALSRLAILPNPNRPELADQDKFVESPWAVVPLPTVDPNLWDDAKTVVVDLDDLYGTDAILKRKNIKKHIETMGQAVTPYRSYALIAEVAGKLIIIDGHHRLMATWLLGQDTAAVYKIEIP
jgi:hypothetical protein